MHIVLFTIGYGLFLLFKLVFGCAIEKCGIDCIKYVRHKNIAIDLDITAFLLVNSSSATASALVLHYSSLKNVKRKCITKSLRGTNRHALSSHSSTT